MVEDKLTQSMIAASKLAKLNGRDDQEGAHIEATGILLDFLKDNGFSELAEAYENADDRVGFWYS